MIQLCIVDRKDSLLSVDDILHIGENCTATNIQQHTSRQGHVTSLLNI